MKCLCNYLLLVVLVFTVNGCKEQKMEVGKPAPDIAAKDAQGNIVHLDDYQGKPVLLEFLSKTCGACLISIPKFNRLQAQNEDRLVVLTVATDLQESELADFAKTNKINYLLVADQLGITKERYQIMGYPTLMYLNREHILESIEQGVTTNPNWAKKVTRWVDDQYL
ncbi:MAG: thioredoxin [Gammaproteobacteria bacterium]|nr:MAG: thioredoxin [Gammaproteobacteria bacterium]